MSAGEPTDELATRAPAGDDDLPAGVRRERMLDVVRSREFTPVSELGAMFGISEVTVRGDLDARGRARSSARGRCDHGR